MPSVSKEANATRRPKAAFTEKIFQAEADATILADLFRAVRTIGIHDDDIVAPNEAIQTPREIDLLVKCEDENAHSVFWFLWSHS